jgi:hypothetical protein
MTTPQTIDHEQPGRGPARGTCTSCKAAILWVRSASSGKAMPLDAKPEKRVVLGSAITTLSPNDGLVVGAQHPGTALVAKVVDVYTSHFATCPSAAAHRGKRWPA